MTSHTRKIKEIIVLEQAGEDLIEGKKFYNINEEGIGDYFFDCIISDIESIYLYAGVHSKHFGLFRMLAKRFPFAIYYDITDDIAMVVAILDLRRDPSWIRKKLTGKLKK